LVNHRRSYTEALRYPPNQVFIGNLRPYDLWDWPEPWFRNGVTNAQRDGQHGQIIPQDEFYWLMKACDEFDLLWLSEAFVSESISAAKASLIMGDADIEKVGRGRTKREIADKIASGAAIPIFMHDETVGCFLAGHQEDASLEAQVLLENLAAKGSAVAALRHVFRKNQIDPGSVDYLLGCGEEAVGDRYNRGGGSLSKAIGEKSGCVNASGSDVKAFCCGPNHAIVMAAALVTGGLFGTVAVTGGGSLAKLGMKYEGHVKRGMPILEDVLGAIAVVLGNDDGLSPMIDLNSIGKHDIGAGSSQQAIVESIVLSPLARCDMRLSDVGRFATELHNPEVTVPQGSGNVPRTNYRILASLAAQQGEIRRENIETFVRERGMPGYSPTQGHIASAVPFLGHARDELIYGTINSVFFLAKGSLFLGRMTQLADGLSFLLRRNPRLPRVNRAAQEVLGH
jgi:betaine reductase